MVSKPNVVALLLGCCALLFPRVVTGQTSSAEDWESALVDEWASIGDCAPSTGMCAACGFGVVVVDLNGDSGAEVRTYTTGAAGVPAPWDADNTFEIASVTKPLTSIATLIMEIDGILSRDSTIGEFLPCDWDAANSDVASITLLEIIQHQSGLPAQPPDRGPSVGGNPFAGYTEERLCASLLKLNGLPTRGRYSYSNYAYGTLGYVLTLAKDPETPPDYEVIIKDLILTPLGMADTSVTYSDNFATAAQACSRGINRGSNTIRTGAYATLQGNGAVRSTLNDMAKFMLVALYVDAGLPTPVDESLYGGLPTPSDAVTKIYNAMVMQHSLDDTKLSCSCVSDWCEGLLCPLPNPYNEVITIGGMEGYTSGGVPGWRKSGDTGGYSSRLAYSADKGRAAFALDTCGGCGGSGTAGSASQRAALLLADGPPMGAVAVSAVSRAVGGDAAELFFTGDALSLVFPSLAQVNVEVSVMGEEAMIAVSSSDGTGSSTTAMSQGDGLWTFEDEVLFGTGWKANADPFTALSQKRSLVIASDGMSALLQDMGADTFVQAPMMEKEDEKEEEKEEEKGDEDSSAVKSIGTSALLMMAALFFYF
jgi:CubicO group peptidase (beta-lactamase class C family)